MSNTQFSGNGHKRAILYSRVSTTDQAKEDKTSLSTQLEACERYAEQNGFTIVGRFSDDYTGTVPLESRPEGHKAFTMLKSGAADCLVAYRMDRLARPPEESDEWDTPLLIRGLARLGKELHTVNRGQLKTDFASLLIAMLDAKGAGDERRNILERTMRGKIAGVKAGKSLVGGILAYGYTSDDKTKTLVIDETEAATVAYIFDKYVSGWTLRRIAKDLTASGIPTPRDTKRKIHGKKNGEWGRTTVLHILKNKTYTGVLEYGRSGGHVLAVTSAPPIIDQQTFDAAQKRIKYNKAMSLRNCKRNHLMRGRVRCGCGTVFTLKISHSHTYIQCNSNNNTHGKQCHERSIRLEVIEGVVWDFVKCIMKSRPLFQKMLEEAKADDEKALQPILDRLAATDKLIQEATEHTESLTLSIANLRKRKGTESARAALETELENTTTRIEKLKAKRQEVELELQAHTPTTDDDIAATMREYDETQEDFENVDFSRKLYWVERLDIRVTVKDGIINLNGKHPIKSASVKVVGAYGAFQNRFGGKSDPALYTRMIGAGAILKKEGRNWVQFARKF